MLNNYRVTFGGDNIDYKSNFSDCRKEINNIKVILNSLKIYGVKDEKFLPEIIKRILTV